MKRIESDPDFQVFLLDSESVEETGPAIQMKPTKVYIHKHGDVHDRPSFTFILEAPGQQKVIAQLSARMFWPAVLAVLDLGGEA